MVWNTVWTSLWKLWKLTSLNPPKKLWKNPKFFKASLIETKHVYCHKYVTCGNIWQKSKLCKILTRDVYAPPLYKLATKQITIKIPSPLSQQVQKQSVIRDIGLCKLILSWGQADFYGSFVLCNFSSSPKYFLSDAMMGSDINNIFTSIKCTFLAYWYYIDT